MNEPNPWDFTMRTNNSNNIGTVGSEEYSVTPTNKSLKFLSSSLLSSSPTNINNSSKSLMRASSLQIMKSPYMSPYNSLKRLGIIITITFCIISSNYIVYTISITSFILYQ